MDNVVNFPEQAPYLLCNIGITRFPDGTIRAGIQTMPRAVIEATGVDVADRVNIIAGWLLDGAVDMERQARSWAEALHSDIAPNA